MTSFKKARSSNWIEADTEFGDFTSREDPSLSSKKGKKRARVNNNTVRTTPVKSVSDTSSLHSGASKFSSSSFSASALDSAELWINNHQPGNVQELAVNSKKVEEVDCWLQGARTGGGCLVLSGPPGCGKTATLLALAGRLELRVQEWLNPVEQTSYDSQALYEGRGVWALSWKQVVLLSGLGEPLGDLGPVSQDPVDSHCFASPGNRCLVQTSIND